MLKKPVSKLFYGTGQNISEGVPATMRNRVDCNFEDGGNLDSVLWQDGEYIGDPNLLPGFSLDFSDSPQQMGLYLAMLATEYKLLTLNNQNTSGTIKELYNALWAINRWDDCETNYPWLQGSAQNGVNYYYHKNYQYVPNKNNLNGQCLRSEYYRGNYNDIQNYPGFEIKYKEHLKSLLRNLGLMTSGIGGSKG